MLTRAEFESWPSTVTITSVSPMLWRTSERSFCFNDLGACGTRGADRHKEPTVLGVDHGVSESALVQSVVGPDYGSRAHHRNGHGILPLPAHGGKEEESLIGLSRGRVKSRRGMPKTKSKPF